MFSHLHETGRRSIAAVVDLGTNAARLAMATMDASGRLVSRGRWRELIRFGEGVAVSGELSPAAIARGLDCLSRFSRIIDEHCVDTLDALATSALREASNREEFLRQARSIGIPLRVIEPQEEARLALGGVLAGLDQPPRRALVLDIGGGSLEVIHSEEERLLEMVSLPSGVVYLTERHLHQMPTPLEQVEACASAVRVLLRTVSFLPFQVAGGDLFGCGGVVALAWFLQEGRRRGHGIHGTMVQAEEVEQWVRRFASLDFNGRRGLDGFESGREDVALAGLIVLREFLAQSGHSALRVSTGGVREGRLLELLSGGRM